jgi:hypothetical protein
MLPEIAARVDDLTRTTDIVRLKARSGVRHSGAVRQAEAILRSGSRKRRDELVPPVANVHELTLASVELDHYPLERGRPQAEPYRSIFQ